MHSSVQYMMVKAMVRDRNAERVDYNMMIISLLNINCESGCFLISDHYLLLTIRQ